VNPSERSPLARPGLRASDADRDQVAELLNTAYAEGRITDEEHTERLIATNLAKTFDELLPLTADLVPAAQQRPATPHAFSGAGPDEVDRMSAVLSEVKRQGPWRVRRRSLANVFLGSVQLDLTEAVFDTQVVEVNVTVVLGSLHLRVPAGTTVRDETASVLAETSVKGIGAPDPRFPVVVLRGTTLLGEIKVRGPKRSSMWRRALT
jgi:DUF1707 SHOCT-like domain